MALKKGKYKLPLILLLCSVLVGVAVYVLLPLWLSTEAIKKGIAAEIQRKLGREVSIGKLQFDWNHGLGIYDLRIKRRNGFGDGLLVRVGRIWCPFEPRQLWRKRLSELRITDAELYMVTKKDGQVNIDDIIALQNNGTQSPNMVIEAITIGNSSAHVVDATGKEIIIDIDNARLNRDRPREYSINIGVNVWPVGAAGKKPVGIELTEAKVSPNRFVGGGIVIRAGNSRIILAVDIEYPELWQSNGGDNATSIPKDVEKVWLKGQIDMLADRIDADELAGLFEGDDSQAVPEEDALEEVMEWLGGCELAGSVSIERLSHTDPRSRSRLHPEQIHCRYQLQNGRIELEYQTALNGGIVQGKTQCDLKQPGGSITSRRVSRYLEVDDSLRPLVESEFPGLVVNGTISEEYELQNTLSCLLREGQKTGPPPKTREETIWQSDECGWSGTGTSVCIDGFLYGPGGPKWLITVFPGLQLVEYRWDKMTNKYKCLGDGSKKNHIQFKSDSYDIYLDGVTRAVREPKEYAAAMEAMENDLRIRREELAEADQGKLKIGFRKWQWLRRQVKGLEKLNRRRLEGKSQTISVADYTVGGVVKGKSKKLFEKGKEYLRVPIFRSHGFIIDGFMVGLEITNVPLGM